MEMQFSNRADTFKEGIFTTLKRKKEEMIAKGVKIYDLSVGTPDFKPSQHVIDAVVEAAKKPENFKYSLGDLPELTEAVKSFYMKRFGVSLNNNEIMSVNGSQEGIAHIGLALFNPGDIVLVPNPGYPVFEIGPFLCGANVVKYPLYKENGFLPDIDTIDKDIALKAKAMIISFPMNPVGAVADDQLFIKLIEFAKTYNIILIHDSAYSDIVHGDKKGKSFMSYPGAKEVGVEFYSLSKSFDLTGARISFLVGNEKIIEKFKMVRSQIDYGIFFPVQYGAIAALTGPFDDVIKQGEIYEQRNKALCGGLRSIGWHVPDSQGTMFVWAPIPTNYNSSEQFAMELIEKAGVIVVPGTAFGSLGEGYVRMALVNDVAIIEEVIKVIDQSGILHT